MIQIEDSIVVEEILAHVGEQRMRAKLTDKPFELGIVTDKRPSQILTLIHSEKNKAALKEIGMTDFEWHDDALRSELKVAGENLLFSICRPR
ncbi:MAG TPA: hypothetical protein VK983_00215 [Candidatus Limnocylindrales bacterium]|nr:hypothetical protein [Candidatus Limnocylindrales bacterium]